MSDDVNQLANVPPPQIVSTPQEIEAARKAIAAHEVFEVESGAVSFGADDPDDADDWKPPF